MAETTLNPNFDVVASGKTQFTSSKYEFQIQWKFNGTLVKPMIDFISLRK